MLFRYFLDGKYLNARYPNQVLFRHVTASKSQLGARASYIISTFYATLSNSCRGLDQSAAPASSSQR